MTKEGKFRASESYWHEEAGLFSNLYRTSNPLLVAARVFLKQRQDLIARYVIQNTGAAALDVGCGSGELVGQLSGYYGKVVGADYSEIMLSQARKAIHAPNVEFVKADCAALPFDDRIFDALYALGLLDYVKDVNGVLRELARVLKPGARAVLTAPKSPSLFAPLRWSQRFRGMLFKIPPIVNTFSRDAWTRAADAAGFRQLELTSLWTTMWIARLEKK